MASVLRCVCLVAALWPASMVVAQSDEPAIDFSAYYGTTQEDGAGARRQVRQTLAERFPPGTPIANVIAFFSDLTERANDGTGDPLNIRFCNRRPGGESYVCIWFADIPQDMSDEALVEGIYGLTWEIVIDVDEDDAVSDFSVDFLIERL